MQLLEKLRAEAEKRDAERKAELDKRFDQFFEEIRIMNNEIKEIKIGQSRIEGIQSTYSTK